MGRLAIPVYVEYDPLSEALTISFNDARLNGRGESIDDRMGCQAIFDAEDHIAGLDVLAEYLPRAFMERIRSEYAAKSPPRDARTGASP